MCVNEEVLAAEEALVEEVKATEEPKKKPKVKFADCPVVGFDPRFGIVAFTLDGCFCQCNVPVGTPIGKTVRVKYRGTHGKDFEWELDL